MIPVTVTGCGDLTFIRFRILMLDNLAPWVVHWHRRQHTTAIHGIQAPGTRTGRTGYIEASGVLPGGFFILRGSVMRTQTHPAGRCRGDTVRVW